MGFLTTLDEMRRRARARKLLKETLRGAETVKAMREDLLDAATRDGLARLMADARRAVRRGSRAEAEALAHTLGTLLNRLSPPRPLAGWRGNFEVLVVALSVAMAFRAYFYQPFKIPTGSMYPTLSGIASREQAGPRLRDRMPLKLASWLVTGEWYKEVRVRVGGMVAPVLRDDSKPGYFACQVGGRRYYVPGDAPLLQALRAGNRVQVASGARLWSGVVTAGDFVFVNRWLWNFRRPRRGEVMVFSTAGIPTLPSGTHYIKRMCGLPGETVSIRPPNLLIDGDAVFEPGMIGKIARCGKLAPWAPHYAGFTVPGMTRTHPQGLMMPEDKVPLAGDEYYALGDNSRNSLDSRFWGAVPGRNLLGPATVVYWPLTSPRLGRIR